jgi:osmotically-inducible protein OsmY
VGNGVSHRARRQAGRHRKQRQPDPGPGIVVAAADQRRDQSRAIRLELLSRLKEQSWTDFGSRNVIVNDGEVHLWGLVGSEAEHKALIAIAESVPGVKTVVDEMIPAY